MSAAIRENLPNEFVELVDDFTDLFAKLIIASAHGLRAPSALMDALDRLLVPDPVLR